MYSTCLRPRLRVGGDDELVAWSVYIHPTESAGVMHGVPFRRALTPVYKGEITPPTIPAFSELD